MDQQSKKIFSTILLAVGALFVIVSGSIFVSSTWRYLPEFLRAFLLAAVAAGTFAGYAYFENKTTLTKTPTVLYYIGICFTGFTTDALLHATSLIQSRYSVLLIDMIAMSAPLIFRFLKKKKLADMIFQFLLADGMILCFVHMEILSRMEALQITMSTLLLALALLVKYLKQNEEDKKLILTTFIVYGIHFVAALFLMMIYKTMGFVFYYDLSDNQFFCCTIPAIMIAASLTLIYLTYKNSFLRVCQSISLWVACYEVWYFIIELFPTDMYTWHKTNLLYFLLVLTYAILAKVLERKEMFVITIVGCFWIELIRVISLTNLGHYIEMGLHGKEHQMLFYPITLALLVILLIRRFYFGRRDLFNKNSTLITIGLLAVNTALSSLVKNYAGNFGIVFWLALVFLMIACTQEQKVIRAIMQSFALTLFLNALLCHEIIPVKYSSDFLSADFSAEYIVVCVALGIVLLRVIWYDIYRKITKVQFVSTCVLLGILLIQNLANQELLNVMFLAIVALIILIIASILKNKEYSIASAVTLVLVVLYMTRAFWMSIAWWVYLFVAGVGLILFAIKKEKAE